jgi:hypothetical protein
VDELDRELAALAAERREPLTSWTRPYDIGAYLAGGRVRPRPELLRRSDGQGTMYRGRLNEVHGPPEAGKGFVAGLLAAEHLARGERVVYLDFDQDPDAVIERVLAAGAIRGDLDRLDLHPIDTPLPVRMDAKIRYLTQTADEILAELIDATALVVLDGVNAGMSMHGMSALSEQDYSDFTRLFAFRFRRAGATGLLCDHVPKHETGGGRFAYGTVQKLAVLDGAVYEVRVVRQPAQETMGELKLVVAKDRPGGVRAFATEQRGALVAASVLIDDTGEQTTVELALPTEAVEFRPTWYMEKVSRFVEDGGDPISQTKIEGAKLGRVEYVRDAVRMLVRDGYLSREEGPRGAFLHASLRPFRDGQP